MAQFSGETFHKLVDFLVPLMNKETRQSFLEYALHGSICLKHIPFSDKASFPFTVDLVKTLELYDGEDNSGITPIVAVLKAAQRHVGEERQREIEDLLNQVKPVTHTVQWQGSPYPGLHFFTPDMAPIYFGREIEIDKLLARLSYDPRCGFLGVVGASGSGKSSLIMAGLLRKLEENAIAGSDQWVWEHIVPGKEKDPFKSLAWALDNKLKRFGYRPQEIAERLADDYSVLNELTARLLLGRGNKAELLLLIDQMEELFTLCIHDKVGPFIELIDYAAHRPRVRIVATLRADFYPHCLAYEPLAQLLESSINLSVPGTAALLEMINKPANCAGLELDQGLSNRLLEDSGNEPGALALTAFTLSELYRKRDGNRLTLKVYGQFGGVQGAIGHHAQSLFNKLKKPVRDEFATVFSELVSVNAEGKPTRRRALMKHFEANPAAVEFITRLSGEKGRLLVTDQTDEYATVEVAHEKLFESWPKLKDWIDERRDAFRLKQQVKTAARQWAESGHQVSHLWRHERLEPVYEMLERLEVTQPEEPLKSFVRKEADRLLEELDDVKTTHYRRAEIGDRLAQIGDPRAGVGVDEQGAPDIDWVRVPGGRVVLEGGAGTFKVDPFFIARYPVTYRQYRAFVEANDGYKNKRWWDDLKHKEKWGEQYRPIDNCPAEMVSWFDAMAFCRWLSAKLDSEVRLPTEWEWQQAVTGGNPKNNYPWGADWDDRFANTTESHLSRTTAAGMYPRGRTIQGTCDMAGNICMTNEFSGYIVRRLCRIAALEHENHKNNYALRVVPCSATNPTHSLHPKTHPSWV